MAAVVSTQLLGGDALIAPARSSEKDLKWEQEGLEAMGLAITVLSASLTSIFIEQVVNLQASFVSNKPLKLKNFD